MRRRMRVPLTILCFNLSAGIAISQQPAKTGRQANPSSSDASTAAADSMPRSSWTAKYLVGSLHLKTDSWLRIAFVPQGAITRKNNLLITVHADQIVSVGYSAKGERNSDRIQGPRSGCSYARAMMPNLAKSQPQSMVAIEVVPRLASRLEDKLDFHHRVQFVWIENGKQERMNVNIIDCEYESFVENLRWLLGTRWNEVAHDLKVATATADRDQGAGIQGRGAEIRSRAGTVGGPGPAPGGAGTRFFDSDDENGDEAAVYSLMRFAPMRWMGARCPMGCTSEVF
jgi:hypothetical protein